MNKNTRLTKVTDKDIIRTLTVRMIADTHSTSSAREIINENFKALSYGFQIIKDLPLDFIMNVDTPSSPSKDYTYGLIYNEITGKFSFTPTYPYAGKWHVRSDERLYIPEDYQHIVAGQFLNEGETVIDGELVII